MIQTITINFGKKKPETETITKIVQEYLGDGIGHAKLERHQLTVHLHGVSTDPTRHLSWRKDANPEPAELASRSRYFDVFLTPVRNTIEVRLNNQGRLSPLDLLDSLSNIGRWQSSKSRIISEYPGTLPGFY